MAESVALVDYGAGNLHSVENALRKVGADVTVTADPDVLRLLPPLVLRPKHVRRLATALGNITPIT